MRKIFFITFSSLSLFWLWSVKALAQDQFGINDFASGGVNLGTRPLRETISGIVNITLGFLGILAVLLILYGGYMWMTSSGNADRIQKAKMIIISAIIGLVIVLTAYAVSRFILASLYDAAGPGGSATSTSTPPGGLPGCDEPADPNEPVICSISRTSGPAGTYLTIRGWHFDTNGNNDPDAPLGQVRIGGQVAEVVSCGGSPMWLSTRVKVKVPALPFGIHNIDLDNDIGRAVGGVPFTFNVNGSVLGPNIACLIPSDADAIALPSLVTIEGAGFGTAGNLTMTGWDTTGDVEIPLTNTDLNISLWSDIKIDFQVPSNAITSQVVVEVAGESSQELFTVNCTADTQCSLSSGCCFNNNYCAAESICAGTGVPGGPHIDSISPDNGEEDNLVTIYGSGFGDLEGVVNFETATGINPSSLNPSCIDNWTDNYIIIAVPDTATGQVTITQNIAEGGVTSNAVDFTRNTTVRPGICGLSASSGEFEDDIFIYGLNFTFPAPPDDKVFFGSFESQDVSVTSNLIASAQVPNVLGNVAVVLESGASTEETNPFPFTVLSSVEGLPIINEISPTSGPVGQYITIMGANFGTSQGRVLFDAGGANIDGDFNFPEVCGDNYWRNDRIIVKVPDDPAIPPVNTYPIRVVRNGDAAASNDKDFQITNGTPGPQVCDMSPDNGPASTAVNFFGENFGSSAGDVVFYNGISISTPPAIWNDNQIIGAQVPVGAETGFVRVEDTTGSPSNALAFNVGSCTDDAYCSGVYGPGFLCCPGSAGSSCINTPSCGSVNYCEYTWDIDTESDQLTVLDNYPDCDGACVNSMGLVIFNHPIDPLTFSNADIHVYDPSGTDIIGAYTLSGTDLSFGYSVPLSYNTTYTVVLETTFTDIWGDELDVPFSWTFTTGSTMCEITGALISPEYHMSYLTGEQFIYSVLGTNDTTSCGPTPVFCDPGMCTYAWTLGDPTIALIVGYPTPNQVLVQNDLVSGSDSTTVNGTITDNSTGVPHGFSASGELEMDITGVANPPLGIINRTPDCNGVCDNPIIEVEFNNNTNQTTLDTSKISIYDATGTDIFNNTVDFPAPTFYKMQIGHPTLAHNQTYRVVLEPGFITDVNGDTINSNYSWSFTTGETRCVIDEVRVSPNDRLSTVSGETIATAFSATPMNNSVACGPIPVYCDPGMCAYSWSLSDPAVASIVSATNLDYVDVRNDLLSGTGLTDLEVELTDSSVATPHVFNDSGVLEIDIDTPVVYNTPEIIDYQPVGTNICTNVAPYIDFSEVMNRDSISDHVKLYQDTTSGWQVVAGNFRFSTMSLDADLERETRAVFQSTELLATDTTYWMVIDTPTSIVSIYGLALGPTSLGATPVGGVGWSFETGDHICQIHSAVITPDPDLFTCTGRNDCIGDAPSGGAGNQHEYTANVYDIAGYLLNGVFLNFNWSLSNTLVTPSGSFSGLDLSSVLGTVGTDNGDTTISMSVQSTEDPSSASDSSLINIFLCENPWPSLSYFPWRDTSYNFSTYYCYDSGLEGATVLPYLDYPPVPNPPHSGVLREYIFSVFHSISALENNILASQLGSLEYGKKNNTKLSEENNWLTKLISLAGFNKAIGQSEIPLPAHCVPAAPELEIVSVDETHVGLHWTQPAAGGNPTNFFVERRQVGVETTFSNIANIAVPSNTYSDNTVVGGQTYEYRIWSYNGNVSCMELSLGSSNVVTITATIDQPSIDIIGIRIMPNEDHLSVSDWFARYAPNPNAVGELMQVDGYEALQVGSTIYVAATNINVPTTRLYTNIYIIAYNVGARNDTVNIFNQFVSNFKINININPQENVCDGDNTISCSSDFDCPVGDWCQSQGLKLRRDTKRLGDLVGMSLKLTDYGNSHKACSNNNLIACSIDDNCPGSGTCIPYYPLLNAGTYVSGMSTSKWPSWADPFSPTINVSLPTDPINLFNGCDADADPNTCWNEVANPNEFVCPMNSLVYVYNVLYFGKDYDLAANFEYDLRSPEFGIDFATNLFPEGGGGVSAIEDANLQRHLSSSMTTTYCDGINLSAPGAAASEYCGNGILDSAYCTDPNYSAPADCFTNDADWITAEECDGGFNNNICTELNGNNPWWNPRTVGCNRPGSLNPIGTLIECTWYEPAPAFTVAQCGGYCGDSTLQPYYEGCEGSNFDGSFICSSASDILFCGSGCQPMCNAASGPDYPAAQCGDGFWTEGVEQCDPSADPDGTSGWDCSLGGNLVCNNDCSLGCLGDVGVPYPGQCGDGDFRLYYCSVYCPACESIPNDQYTTYVSLCGAVGGVPVVVEQCDYYSYDNVLPENSSSPHNTYECSSSCLGAGGYCMDDIVQGQYQEICEPDTYVSPQPQDSGRFAQYSCASPADANFVYPPASGIEYGGCTATLGGYCGDGSIQGTRGEGCDPGDPWANPVIPQSPLPPTPNFSRIDNQYSCQLDCTGRTGGYCGDGDAQTQYGELCDGLDYPDRPLPPDSSSSNTYVCAGNCMSSASDGGYCGDGKRQALFGEGCDAWGASDWPWPRGNNLVNFSSPINQYECNSCINGGGYCGNGNVEIYEECDTGFDPAYEIEKNIDLAYVFDMSGSMIADAQNLCSALGSVVTDLNDNHTEIDYRITIFVLGDNDNGVVWDASYSGDVGTYPNPPTFLTNSTADDITTIFSNPNHGWLDEAHQVFQALYTNCPLKNNPDIRYLSFYDNNPADVAYNHINGGVDVFGDAASFGESCTTADGDQFAGRLENWGYAINRIIEDYMWLDDYQRVVVPVSDEMAYCGGNVTIRENENYDSVLPDVLTDAVSISNSLEIPVHISPVLIKRAETPFFNSLVDIGSRLAADTGGLFSQATTGWVTQTMNVINASFCDGNGDNFMDCTLP